MVSRIGLEKVASAITVDAAATMMYVASTISVANCGENDGDDDEMIIMVRRSIHGAGTGGDYDGVGGGSGVMMVVVVMW